MIKRGCNSYEFSPIALFAFNRPEHLTRALEALSKNPEFNLSPLFIYCDGARNAHEIPRVHKTRAIANQWPHPDKTVFISDINLGLAKSIISGVSRIIEEYGQLIVLEDDLVVDQTFLNFLNEGLRKFKNSPRVMQISGYMFPIPEFLERSETFFLPNISSWGWATWSRAWEHFDADALEWNLLLSNRALRREFDVGGSYPYSDMLFRQKMGKIDSWAVRWNWSVFCRSGLVVYPPVSLVRNIGFDGSGTHCDALYFDAIDFARKLKPIEFSEVLQISKADLFYIEASLRKLTGSIYVRLLKSIANNVRRIWLKYNL